MIIVDLALFMSVSPTFLVGISPDWAAWAPGTLDIALKEVFKPLAGLAHEVMADPNGRATKEVESV